MQGLGEVAGDVEPDPGAVFDAHGADSVDELVASGSAPERESTSDRAVDRLFEGGLDRPERTAGTHTERTAGSRPDRPAASQNASDEEPPQETASAVLAELERAVASAADEDAETLGADDLDAIDDGDVEDALAAAETLEDADEEAVPAEWRNP